MYLLLVIVAEPEGRRRLSECLRQRGFAVTASATFAEALGMTSVLQPDVVITEIEPTPAERITLPDKVPVLVF